MRTQIKLLIVALSHLLFITVKKISTVESFNFSLKCACSHSRGNLHCLLKREHRGSATDVTYSANRNPSPIRNTFRVVASSVSQRTVRKLSPVDLGNEGSTEKDTKMLQIITLLRIALPSILAGVLASLAFPFLALSLATIMNDAGVFAVLSQDSSQFVQNFLTVSSLLFSILIGQTYYFMYIQQEAVYYSLFNEVTEAKSLLEQVALVCQGRSMYIPMLKFIQKYVKEDLKQLHKDPAVLLSARPVDDPLESIMYMTSVGVPSIIYETVRSLRQARAARLGALQRKLPKVHMWLLWILAGIELMSFPLLGAGTQSIGGYRILTVEGCLFGVLTFGIVMTLRIVGELWRPAGGAYNVDGVLRVMVRGLEEELNARMSGKTYAATLNFPLPQFVTGPDPDRFVNAVEAELDQASKAGNSVILPLSNFQK